jgi:hypothetical protein
MSLRGPLPWSAHTTEIIPASGCSNANTSVDSLVPLIIHVIQNVHKRVDNGVVIDVARNHAGNLAPRVWSHASGTVLTIRVRWCAAR